jgi:hypothetical protein
VERRTGDDGDERASRRRQAGAGAAQGDRGLEERRGERRCGGEAVDWPVGRQRRRGEARRSSIEDGAERASTGPTCRRGMVLTPERPRGRTTGKMLPLRVF